MERSGAASFLVADFIGFERYAHLRPVLLAGGDAAVREPWRVARSYLHDAFGAGLPAGEQPAGAAHAEKVRLLDLMLERRLHTIETSSCGRLFDAVASLIGLRHAVSFEGQAAMQLEAIAVPDDTSRYEFAVQDRYPVQIDFRPMVRQIVAEARRGERAGCIAARFHNTLVAALAQVCRRMREELGLSRVCLSGGCFQNARLLRGCLDTLRSDRFEVYFQRHVPANDGGISLGQAAIACALVTLVS